MALVTRQKQQILFLIGSRTTDYKLGWTWDYEAPLQGNFHFFGTCCILVEDICEHWSCTIQRKLSLINWHHNWNCIVCMWRNVNMHHISRPAVSGTNRDTCIICMVIRFWGYGKYMRMMRWIKVSFAWHLDTTRMICHSDCGNVI